MVLTPRRCSLPAWVAVTRGSTVTGEESEWAGSGSLRRDGLEGAGLRFGGGLFFLGVPGSVSNNLRVSSTHLFRWVPVMLA